MPLNNINILQPNHLRLVTLGRLALSVSEDSPAAPLAKQRRKLAVLAFLAMAKRPVSRDALAEMFWGDKPDERARHSLSEALSHLRRVLGADAITQRQAEVALSADAAVTIDAVEFAAAAERGDLEDAIALYGGPFLDAVYVGGSARFEEWVDGERRRLEKIFADLCRRHYPHLAEQKRWQECATVAERWWQAEPLSEAAMLALLDASADVRRDVERVRAKLRSEYELDVPAAVAARAAAPPRSVAATVEMPPSTHKARSKRAWAAAAMVVAVMIIGMTTFALLGRDEEARAATSNVVAVMPFIVRGPAEFAYLGEGVVDLLSADLDGAGRFRSVNPRAVLAATASRKEALSLESARAAATKLGAELYVLGDVVIAGDRVRISASLYSHSWGSAPAAQAAVEGTPDELFGMVDELTAQLLAASPGVTPEPLGRLAAMTTRSLPALKHYLRGEREYRRGHYVPAFEAFRAATNEDTTFALAHFRLAQAANWATPMGWSWDSLVDRSRIALSHAGRLSTRPRLLVQGYHAWATGQYDDAERAYRTVTRLYPDEVEGWYQLGEVLFHTNPMRGRSILEARAPFARVIALEPAHLGALTHMVRVAAREGRRAEVDSLLTRLTQLNPPDRQLEFAALRAFLLRDRSAQDSAVAGLRQSGDDELIRALAHRIAVYGGNLDGAMRLLPLLTAPTLRADVRAHAHAWMSDLEAAQGRWSNARAHLDTAATLDRTIALERRALLESLSFALSSPAELRAVRDALLKHQPVEAARYPWLAVYDGMHAELREYLLGVLSLRLGDARAAERYAGMLETRALAQTLRARIAAANGDVERALALFDAGRFRAAEGFLESEFGSQAAERWERAELLFQAGRYHEARKWYASLPEISIAGMVYRAPVSAREAAMVAPRAVAPF